MAFANCALQGFQRASEKVKWIHDIYQKFRKMYLMYVLYSDVEVLTFLLSSS